MTATNEKSTEAGSALRAGDYWVALAFFLGSLALRVPFRSQMAYHWDSAEFALAIRDYNVALSQPHAPGYFLYVMAGRLVNFFLGDPHASLVWLSVVSGSGFVALLYVNGVEMFGRRTGLAAGVLALSSPQVWFHSCVALTYIVDGALVCLVVFCCWRAMNYGGRWRDVVLIGALLALLGGVRQQTIPALAPLVLYTFWRFERLRGPKLLTAAGVAVALGMMWFVPMVELSGGLPVYLQVVRRHAAFNAPDTWAVGGTRALLRNIALTGEFCWNGLVLGAAVLGAALTYRVCACDAERKRAWDAEHKRALQVLTIWLVPPVLLDTVVGFTKQPGYVLSYLPCLLLLVAVAVSQLRSGVVFAGAVAALCAASAAVFLVLPRTWDDTLFYGWGCSAREIRVHDEQLASAVEMIRAECKPSTAIICHASEFLNFGLRQFQLYLPEFEQYLLELDSAMVTPPDKPMLSVRGEELGFVSGPPLDSKRTVLLIVPPGFAPTIFKPTFELKGLRRIGDAGGLVYALPAGDATGS
jgi:hypothetical protein